MKAGGKPKLTEKEVISIRKEYAITKCTQKHLSEKYNISMSVISSVVRGFIWKKIGGPIVGRLYRYSKER